MEIFLDVFEGFMVFNPRSTFDKLSLRENSKRTSRPNMGCLPRPWLNILEFLGGFLLTTCLQSCPAPKRKAFSSGHMKDLQNISFQILTKLRRDSFPRAGCFTAVLSHGRLLLRVFQAPGEAGSDDFGVAT